MIGSASAILPEFQSNNNTSIETLTDVIVLWVSYRSLLVAGPKLGRTHGLVMRNLLEAFCSKNVMMMEKIQLLSQKTLRERLIVYLLQREINAVEIGCSSFAADGGQRSGHGRWQGAEGRQPAPPHGYGDTGAPFLSAPYGQGKYGFFAGA